MKAKARKRVFTFKNYLDNPKAKVWANEVIESIEKDELLVIDPKDQSALDEEVNSEGHIVVNAQARIPVSIREWLCVGCQSIKFPSYYLEQEQGHSAWYSHNGAQVLWPSSALYQVPEGPAAFIGEIFISRKFWNYVLSEKSLSEKRFKFMFAHELVHVFDVMRYAVPAFLDWNNFWVRVLGSGAYCENLCSKLNMVQLFIDSYGKLNECLSIKEFWPSQADEWFNALRKIMKNNQE